MKLPHESLSGSVIAGIVLTLILYIVVRFLVNDAFLPGIG